MEQAEYSDLAAAKIEELARDQAIGQFIDCSLASPQPFGPASGARLVVLGQDPTVKHAPSRRRVKVVLNLDRRGALRSYLQDLCGLLDMELDCDVTGINVANNFFIEPPTQLPAHVLPRAIQAWLPIVRRQITDHPGACVITLGEPLLEAICEGEASRRVRTYLGYRNSKSPGDPNRFTFLSAADNALGIDIHPFPHQPSRNRLFYRLTLPEYTAWVGQRRGRAA